MNMTFSRKHGFIHLTSTTSKTTAPERMRNAELWSTLASWTKKRAKTIHLLCLYASQKLDAKAEASSLLEKSKKSKRKSMSI